MLLWAPAFWEGEEKIKGFSQLGHIPFMIIWILHEADCSSHKYPISEDKTGKEKAFNVWGQLCFAGTKCAYEQCSGSPGKDLGTLISSWIFFLGSEWYRLQGVYEILKCKVLAKEPTLAHSVEMQTYMQFILVKDANEEGGV